MAALDKLTAVGFDPTPFRTGALSQRLRPLGQTVRRVDGGHTAQCGCNARTRLTWVPLESQANRGEVGRRRVAVGRVAVGGWLSASGCRTSGRQPILSEWLSASGCRTAPPRQPLLDARRQSLADSRSCVIFVRVTAVGFEPTPFRTGALSQRLRPLGQTVIGNVAAKLLSAAGASSSTWGAFGATADTRCFALWQARRRSPLKAPSCESPQRCPRGGGGLGVLRTMGRRARWRGSAKTAPSFRPEWV